MNLRRNHFWLGGNIDQDLLSRFPKGISVWLGGMRDLKDIWSSTMEERESEEYELIFCAKVSLGEEGGSLLRPPKFDHYSKLFVTPEWLRPLLQPSPEQLWLVLQSRVEACQLHCSARSTIRSCSDRCSGLARNSSGWYSGAKLEAW
jgi:hypothetical protein